MVSCCWGILFFFCFQVNVVLKEKETFIDYLQKQLDETKSKLDSEVSTELKLCTSSHMGLSLGYWTLLQVKTVP